MVLEHRPHVEVGMGDLPTAPMVIIAVPRALDPPQYVSRARHTKFYRDRVNVDSGDMLGPQRVIGEACTTPPTLDRIQEGRRLVAVDPQLEVACSIAAFGQHSHDARHLS